MTIATLVKITAAKKLMMKISEKTYDMITARLTAECKKKNFPTDRLATFSLESDDGDDCHFVMISLDKYDKQNMRKFEQLLKKDVAVQYRFKPYDFIPDGEDEQRCGINLELISIRQMKPKPDVFVLRPVKSMTLKDVLSELAPKPKIKWDADLQKFDIPSSDSDSDTDEIADKAAARATNPSKELNAEERAIDEDVEKQVTSVLAQLPPKLERQTATGMPVATAVTRRRRTPTTATEQELTDVQKQVKYLDDLIAANERAIGADE